MSTPVVPSLSTVRQCAFLPFVRGSHHFPVNSAEGRGNINDKPCIGGSRVLRGLKPDDVTMPVTAGSSPRAGCSTNLREGT